MRWSRLKQFVAIDYDSRQLRLVLLESARKGCSVIALHSYAVPEGADIADSAVLGRLLATIASQLKLRRAGAILCVDRSQAVLKPLSLPPGCSENEVASMVAFQVAKELPFGAEEAVIDYTLGRHWDASAADASADSTQVLAAALQLVQVESCKAACAAAGLEPAHLLLRPWANLLAVKRCVRCQAGESILFVDVMADRAEIDIFRDGEIEFSRCATLAGASESGEVADAAGRVRRVVTEVLRSVQGFHAAHGRGGIDGCLIGGTTGIEEALARELAAKLGSPAQRFNPAGGFGLPPSPDIFAFGAALGMSCLGPQEPHFDFLHPKRPAPPKDTRRLKLLGAAAAAVVLLVATLGARGKIVGAREAQVETVRRQVNQLDQDVRQLKKLEDRLRAITLWRDEDIHSLDQLAHLSNTLPGAEEVYITSFQSAPGKFTILGKAKDDKALTRFISQLSETTGYKPEPRGTSSAADKYGYTVQFTLEVLVSDQARPVIASSRPTGRPADDSAGKPAPAPAPAPAPRITAPPAPAARGTGENAPAQPAQRGPRRARP